jgi:hypothetical protein
MNKMDILRLAFEKTAKPEDAMRLAREMVDFVSSYGVNKVPEFAPKPVDRAANSRKYWANKEIEALIDMTADNRPLAEIASALRRTESSCKSAIRRINLGIPMGRPK